MSRVRPWLPPVAFVVFALVTALFGSAVPRALADGDGKDGKKDAPSPWLAERLAALRSALHGAEERGEEKKAGALREEISALERKHDEAGGPHEQDGRAMKVRALRHESEMLEQKGKDLKANGNEDDAKRLMEESGRLWKIADALERGDDGEVSRLAKREGKQEKKEGKQQKQEGDGKEGAQRIEHLFAAAKHLREGGMPDLAERVQKEAQGRLERMRAEAAERAAREQNPMRELEGLRREIQELRKMIDDLRAQLAK